MKNVQLIKQVKEKDLLKIQKWNVNFNGMVPGDYVVDAHTRYEALSKVFAQNKNFPYSKSFLIQCASVRIVGRLPGRHKFNLPTPK